MQAKSRALKSHFFSDDEFANVGPMARYVLLGLFCLADKNGNLQLLLPVIESQIFPFEKIDCNPYIEELTQHNILKPYTANGKKYAHIERWEMFQNPTTAEKSRPTYIPEPEQHQPNHHQSWGDG